MTVYRGRFAPSPSGPLHFGSLVAALGSWLDARYHKGEWLLRIEDIDPPREVAGAADDIQRTLETFGLFWDHQVNYQSSNLSYYQQLLQQLLDERLVYRCTCTRKQIQLTGGIYNGHCRTKQHSESSLHSLRLKVIKPKNSFDDYFQGNCQTKRDVAGEDFILQRKDGLFAYMFAVVADDSRQQISHVIRGADLIDTTIQQQYLFNILKLSPPCYGHLPIAVNHQWMKLSKQNHAMPLAINNVSETLYQALCFLKQSPAEALKFENKEVLLDWAIENWDPSAFAGNLEFIHGDI